MILTTESKTYKNFTIYEFEELESTNKTAFELANLGKISDSEIILSRKQTNGKGRQNRNWSSPAGNLYFSLVLKPQIATKKISLISFVAAAALKNAVENLTKDHTIKLKWPNDLLIEEKKCAGILLESKFNQQNCEFVILGIGVNIDSSPSNVIFPACNLKDFNIKTSSQFFLENFLDEFEKIYKNFLDYGFASTRRIWLENAYKLNEKIIVKINEEEIAGIFENLDNEGNLVLRNNNQLKTIFIGDVS